MNAEELKIIAVLRDVDPAALGRLAAVLEEKEFTDGQTVFVEGDPGESMYFIVNGRVRIEKQASVATANKLLTVLEAGDYFGEMALLDQKPRSAAAVVEGNARILVLSKSAFDEIQRTSSAAAISVLFAMIRTSSQRIRRLSAHLVVYDEVGKGMGEARDLDQLLDIILQQLSSAIGADWGLVVLTSQFSEGLDLRGQSDLALNPEQCAAISKGQGFLGHVLQDPQERLVNDFGQEEPFKSSVCLGFETPSLVLVPLLIERQLLGVIALGGRQRAQFNLDALNLASGVARQTAQAILNARHREEEMARSRHSRQFVRF